MHSFDHENVTILHNRDSIGDALIEPEHPSRLLSAGSRHLPADQKLVHRIDESTFASVNTALENVSYGA
jgi:hypothetical protein